MENNEEYFVEKKEVLPEAGGVAWVELFGKKSDDDGVHDVKINLTSRAGTPLEALQQLLEALSVANEIYKLTPYMKSAKAPERPTAVESAIAQAVPLPMPQEPVYEDIEPQINKIAAVKLVVTPRADGKARLDFYEAGHQYPDIAAVLTPEQLATMMAPIGAWTPEHFKTLATYNVECTVLWKNSQNLNKNGKPYKNIVRVA